MSTRFVNVDRLTPMLLSPDLRDWVPEDDLVHFVIGAIEGLPLKALHVNEPPPGTALKYLISARAPEDPSAQRRAP